MTDDNRSKSGVSRMTDEELLEAAAEIGPRVTVPELADRFDYSHTGMRDRVRKLKDQGDLKVAYQNHNINLYTVPEQVAEAVEKRQQRASRSSIPEITDQVENGDADLQDLQQAFGDVLRLIDSAEDLEPEDLAGADPSSGPEPRGEDGTDPVLIDSLIESVESGDADLEELAAVFDRISRLIQVCSQLPDDQKDQLATELGSTVLVARSPSAFFRDLRDRFEPDRMGYNRRTGASASVR